MADLYLASFLGLFCLPLLFNLREGVRARSTALQFLALALALAFASCLCLLANLEAYAEATSAWFQAKTVPATSMHLTLRAALASTVFEPTALQQAILLSGALTNIVFLAMLAVKPIAILRAALGCALGLCGVSFIFVTTESLAVMFVCFELLLLLSLYLLRLTSKSERVLEASTEMFFWTLFGSLALLALFAWLFTQGISTFALLEERGAPTPTLTLLAVIGFGVKVPIWPFFSWLLKAHVEASVEFSILLSGFIVKLGVFGLFKTLLALGGTAASHLLFALCFLGLCSASMRLFSQRDLKRIVALTTVIEMNWLGLCLAVGGFVFHNLAFYIVIVHSITTALEFSVVESLSRRYGSRDVGCLAGLFAQMPLLGVVSFLVVLVTIGFPGTPLFFAKALFFAQLATLSWGLCVGLAFLLLLVIPLFFIRL